MFKLACTIGEYLMIYLFSGSIVELIKETTISGFIEGVPEPTQDGIGSRYDDEPEEEETEGKEEEEEDIIETEDVDIMDLELEGPSAFVEFIETNQKDIGFGDQDRVVKWITKNCDFVKLRIAIAKKSQFRN